MVVGVVVRVSASGQWMANRSFETVVVRSIVVVSTNLAVLVLVLVNLR